MVSGVGDVMYHHSPTLSVTPALPAIRHIVTFTTEITITNFGIRSIDSIPENVPSMMLNSMTLTVLS